MKTDKQGIVWYSQGELDAMVIIAKDEGKKEKDNSEWVRIPDTNVEIEKETHDLKKELREITIPEGCRLATYDEVIKGINTKVILLNGNNYFYIKQPFLENDKRCLVGAAVRDWNSELNLYCNGTPFNSGDGLGVRRAKIFP